MMHCLYYLYSVIGHLPFFVHTKNNTQRFEILNQLPFSNDNLELKKSKNIVNIQ